MVPNVQTDGCTAILHVQPVATVQVEVQPMPFAAPASHFSPFALSRIPSPQYDVAPGTCLQLALHTVQDVWPYAHFSVPLAAPSSHCSPLSRSTNPSPQDDTTHPPLAAIQIPLPPPLKVQRLPSVDELPAQPVLAWQTLP